MFILGKRDKSDSATGDLPGGEIYSADTRLVTQFFQFVGLLIVLGIILESLPHLSRIGVLLLWALACAFSGGFLGFLFGVPKVLQSEAKAAKAEAAEGHDGYDQRVNTNLTEISDWLTKIIVGVGLVQLGKIPGFLRGVATVLADCLGAPCSISVAIAVTVGCAVLGFLFGYLNTRLFLAGAFSRADRGAARRAHAKEAEAFMLRTAAETAANISTVQSEFNREQLFHAAERLSEVPHEILKMAKNYLDTNFPDYRARVQAKDEIANAIARETTKLNLPRDVLAKSAIQRQDDGLIAGLATLANAFPQKGDTELLLQVAPLTKWKHPKYRVAVAFMRLMQANLVSEEERKRIGSILNLFKQDADEPLKALIRNVEAWIQERQSPSSPTN